MELIGTIVVYIIMACALVGCIASVVRPESELGQQFVAGIDSIGPIFLPVAGIMAAAPYLTAFVSAVFGPAYGAPALLIPEGGVFYALFRPQQFFSLPYSIFAQNLL